MAKMVADSYLIQRLKEPWGGALGLKGNPFSFGGGLRNGGLSDEAMDLIGGIFSFDYMGSAEFEFGAVPEALQKIAKSAEAGGLVGFSLSIPLKVVPGSWDDPDKDKKLTGEEPVYVLCPSAWREDVCERIYEIARGKGHQKESPHFTRALRPFREWDADTHGWLELSNGFFFFLDKEMWEKTCNLFGVTPS